MIPIETTLVKWDEEERSNISPITGDAIKVLT